ncbi:hypothetical protein Tco_0167708 [Tanacetum coccineum]
MELRRNLISLGTLEKVGFTVKMPSGKIKVIKGSLVVLSGTRRANCVYTLDGQAVTRKTLNEDKTMSTYLVNWSPSSAIGFKTPVDMLGLFGWLASIKQGLLEPVKVKCIFLGYRTCIVGNKALEVLQGVEFEVEPKKDHTFKVEPHGNVDHVAGSQEVQTQDLIYYHLARDREQHSTYELFSYREDSNEAAFAVAVVNKIYAHKSLTFSDTVACEDEIWATKGLLDKAKGNVLGMKIVTDQSGNTLRVSQSRFYNGKLVQTLLEGHSIPSLEGSLLGNVMWKRMTDVHVFVDFDYTIGRSITVMARSITSDIYDTYEGCKGGYLAKGTHNKVRIRAKDSSGYCYRCLVKGYP